MVNERERRAPLDGRLVVDLTRATVPNCRRWSKRAQRNSRARSCWRGWRRRVPAGPIRDLAEVFNSPQARHLGREQAQPHPTADEVHTVAASFAFSDNTLALRRPPPTFGQQT
jgi:crotonobetainyl-CoA:carnitine CoA-transferase CaiB-like acyl-CoA transferase